MNTNNYDQGPANALFLRERLAAAGVPVVWHGCSVGLRARAGQSPLRLGPWSRRARETVRHVLPAYGLATGHSGKVPIGSPQPATRLSPASASKRCRISA